MALDIGEVRVGVAVSDPGERVASPVCVMPAAEVTGCAKPFRRLLEDWEPELARLRLPRTLAGEEGPQAAAFARRPRASATPAAFPTFSQMNGSARPRPSGVCVKRV